VKRPAGVSRWVNAAGKISLAGFSCHAGATHAGEPVEAVVADGLVDVLHAGVVATHAQRIRGDQAARLPRAPVARRARDTSAGLTVTRLADGAGVVSFAGTPCPCGRRWARTAIDVSIVAASVQLSKDGKVIRVHPIRHDRTRELGAFANPQSPPPQELSHWQRRLTIMSPGCRNQSVARVPELDKRRLASLGGTHWPEKTVRPRSSITSVTGMTGRFSACRGAGVRIRVRISPQHPARFFVHGMGVASRMSRRPYGMEKGPIWSSPWANCWLAIQTLPSEVIAGAPTGVKDWLSW
jgi:hypothetical protein